MKFNHCDVGINPEYVIWLEKQILKSSKTGNSGECKYCKGLGFEPVNNSLGIHDLCPECKKLDKMSKFILVTNIDISEPTDQNMITIKLDLRHGESLEFDLHEKEAFEFAMLLASKIRDWKSIKRTSV